MDYTKLLTKAWNTVWNNKFLIVLGILAAFGQNASNFGGRGNFRPGNNGGPGPTPTPGDMFPPDVQQQLARGFSEIPPGLIAVGIGIFCLALIVGIIIWVLNRTSEGGLINGVDTIDGGGASSFSLAFRAGWSKIVTLLLIAIIAAIPIIVLAVVVAAMLASYMASGQGELLRDAIRGGNVDRAIRAIITNSGFLLGILAVFCPLVVLSWITKAVALFADRACVIEGKGLVESFQRGYEVLRDHLGNAIALYLLQIVIGIVIALVLALPSFAIALCCFLWPILWVISGTIEAYFSTVWTLAWREWTGKLPAASEPASAAPAPTV